MTAIIAVIVQLLPLLVQIPGDISAVIAWISSIRTAAQTSGEWTDQAEQAYRDSIVADYKAPEQQIDSAAGVLSTKAAQAVIDAQVRAANAFSTAR